jgi:hypothetical protein
MDLEKLGRRPDAKLMIDVRLAVGATVATNVAIAANGILVPEPQSRWGSKDVASKSVIAGGVTASNFSTHFKKRRRSSA